MRIVLRIIHNEHIALIWAFVVEIAVHGFFGLQAFLLGGFLGEVALMKVFGPELGMQIGAWGLGILVFGMSFVSFVLGDYLKMHVQNFVWTGRGSQEYLDAFKETVRLAAGLELSSLAFRVLTVGLHENDWPSALVILVAGCIGLRYAIKMAKVIHASVNRDPKQDLARSQDDARLRLAEKARKSIKTMTPYQLAGWGEGDPAALGEAASHQFFEEEQKRQARAAKRKGKETTVLSEQERIEAEKSSFLERMQQTGQAMSHIRRGYGGGSRHQEDDPPFVKVQANTQASRLSQQNGR